MNQRLPQKTRPWCYWLLLASQSAGAGIILWKGIPIYRQLLLGEPDPGPRLSIFLYALAALALIQPAYWLARRLPPPVRRVSRPLLAHLVIFLGRMVFIYVAGMISVVFYLRYADLRLAFWREALLLAVLFSMFCYTTELERLGKTLLDPTGHDLTSEKSPSSEARKNEVAE